VLSAQEMVLPPSVPAKMDILGHSAMFPEPVIRVYVLMVLDMIAIMKEVVVADQDTLEMTAPLPTTLFALPQEST